MLLNTASVAFDLDGVHQQSPSNTVSIRVAEVLDIALTSDAGTITVVPGALTAVPFTLTNVGNGTERFRLFGTFAAGAVEGFAVDVDNNGQYDPAVDTLLPSDPVTPALAPGQKLRLFALIRSNGSALSDLTLSANAVTGSGRHGTLIPSGSDDGQNDAVVGNTGASATLKFNLVAGTATEATLTKSQTVLDPAGGSSPVHDATITYSLAAHFVSGTATGAEISDIVPSGTTYVPGSITLDSAPLSDAADSDAGSFDGTTVRVALGNIADPVTHTVQFKVIIK